MTKFSPLVGKEVKPRNGRVGKAGKHKGAIGEG